MNLKLRNIAQHPDYLHIFATFYLQTGPGFLSHKDGNEWKLLIDCFNEYQFLIETGKDLHGAVFTLPLYWDGSVESLPASIKEVFMQAGKCYEAKKPVNTLVVLAVVNDEVYYRNGWKSELLSTLKHLAGEKGFTSVLAPVRPNRKCENPLMPLGQYVNWRQADGAPFDPDLREHWELGAVLLAAMPRAMTIEGNVKEWENWTGMRFTESGEYIVDGALRPVIIDLINDCGYYTDENIWMLQNAQAGPQPQSVLA